MDGGFYRGTHTEQDIRFPDKEKKLLKQMKFEDVLEKKVSVLTSFVCVFSSRTKCSLFSPLCFDLRWTAPRSTST